VDIASTLLLATALIVGFLSAYNLLHYILFLLVTHPKDAGDIGHQLNEFEQRQLVEWTPKADDFLKHDDENRTYDDVFGPYRGEHDNYSSCVFPPSVFAHPYSADYALLEPTDGSRLLELGCGSGAAAYYLASQCSVEIVCVTNSPVQANICRRKFETFDGRVRVIVADFDALDFPDESFDAIYALESIGYTKDVDAWLSRCRRWLKPGGRLLVRSPGSLDTCRREQDYRNVTAFFENWRYNFFGANLLVFKMRRLGFNRIRYRQLPFWAWGLTCNFIRHLLLWKFELRMRTMVGLERIIWRTSKLFVFGNGYNVVLASTPAHASTKARLLKVRSLTEESQGRLRWLTPEEATRLLSRCREAENAVLADLVEFCLFTGVRRVEALTLAWERVDRSRGVVVLEPTKSGRRREIPINSDADAVLVRRAPRASGLVFGSSSWRTLRTSWEDAVAGAKIDSLRFRDLRHTFAAWAVQRGATLQEVKDLLGHSSLSMVMRYAHLSPEHLRTAVGRLDGLLTRAPDSAPEGDGPHDLPAVEPTVSP
jgi:integrase/protein-L-isoaspartate O-methyltransferase